MNRAYQERKDRTVHVWRLWPANILWSFPEIGPVRRYDYLISRFRPPCSVLSIRFSDPRARNSRLTCYSHAGKFWGSWGFFFQTKWAFRWHRSVCRTSWCSKWQWSFRSELLNKNGFRRRSKETVDFGDSSKERGIGKKPPWRSIVMSCLVQGAARNFDPFRSSIVPERVDISKFCSRQELRIVLKFPWLKFRIGAPIPSGFFRILEILRESMTVCGEVNSF